MNAVCLDFCVEIGIVLSPPQTLVRLPPLVVGGELARFEDPTPLAMVVVAVVGRWIMRCYILSRRKSFTAAQAHIGAICTPGSTPRVAPPPGGSDHRSRAIAAKVPHGPAVERSRLVLETLHCLRGRIPIKKQGPVEAEVQRQEPKMDRNNAR